MFLPLGDDIDKRTLPLAGGLLVAVNVLIYIYEDRLFYESLPSASLFIDFIKQWGLIPAELAQGRIHALFTHMFLHGDWSHLLGNMLVLWAFVGTMERGIGITRFVVLYFLWGLVAALMHAGMDMHSTRPMIGASGAISGLMGAYFVIFGAMTNIRTLVWFGIRPRKYDIPAGAFACVWLLIQLKGVLFANLVGGDSIAWAAHVGGFLAGVITGLIFKREVKDSMVMALDGQVKFHDDRPMQLSASRDQFEVDPEKCACIYCKTELTDENLIHEQLYRCPNPACGRMVPAEMVNAATA